VSAVRVLQRLTESQGEAHARRLAEVMAVADEYAAAWGVRMFKSNQATRREEVRRRNALQSAVSNILTTARENAK
jgi:hypothetical protein